MSPRKTHREPPAKDDEVLDLDLDTGLISKEELETEEQISEFQARFGGKDYKVRAEKWNPEESDWEYVDRFKLDGFDPYISLRKYGGGRFRLTLLNDRNLYVKGGRNEVRIAKVEAPATAPVPVSPLQDPTVQFLLQSMKDQNTATVEMMKTVLTNQTQAAAAEKGGIGQLIEALAKLKSLSPQESGMNSMKEAFEMMTLVKQLLPEAAEGKGEGILSELGEAVKVAKELGMMGPRGQRALPNPQARPQAPQVVMGGGTAQLSGGQALREPAPVTDPLERAVRKYIPLLVEAAEKGEAPISWASFILDRLEAEFVGLIQAKYRPLPVSAEAIYETMLSKVTDGSALPAILEFAPEMKPYEGWTQLVLDECVKQLSDDDDAQGVLPKPEAEGAA